MRQPLLASSIIFLAFVCAAGSPRTIVAQSSRLVVATGLDNPRGLTFGPDGALYVAEAGRGGNSSLCLPQPGAPPTAPPSCYGPTGAITRIFSLGDQRRVVIGLPSHAPPGGVDAIGPHDISFGFGATWVTIGLGANPLLRGPLEAGGARFGRLARVNPNGSFTEVLDLSAHEVATNPDGGAIDSNPFALTVSSDRAVFTDAGANALIGIAATGALSTLAVFPNRFVPFGGGSIPMQAVPTAVAEAPDGSFFVGELTGFPFPVGAARVYRVPRTGGTPVVVAQGFTNIIDIAASSTGMGYVLEHDADGILGPGTAGRLIRVNTDGSQTVLTNANLNKPGGLTIGPDGAIYVTNNGTSPGGGEVVRLTP
jgi:hypothetical protein